MASTSARSSSDMDIDLTPDEIKEQQFNQVDGKLDLDGKLAQSPYFTFLTVEMKSRVLNSGEITHFTLEPFPPLVNNLLFHPGSTMNGAVPLLPHCYTPAQIQKKDNASMNQSMSVASAPLTKVGMSPLLGPENTLCECPFCNASVKTAVQYSTTSRTHMAAALWCLACCLCCIPYGSDSAKNADHYCPSCHRYLGTYEK